MTTGSIQGSTIKISAELVLDIPHQQDDKGGVRRIEIAHMMDVSSQPHAADDADAARFGYYRQKSPSSESSSSGNTKLT